MVRKDPKLQRLIDSIADQDCDTEEDVAMGLGYAIKENVRFPFLAKVIGEDVTVLGVQEPKGLELFAVCERKGRRFQLRLQDIELRVRPKGFRWVEAYQQFRRPA